MRVPDSALVRRVRQSPLLRPPAIAAFRVIDRLTPAPPGPRVVANSMPKSGTHLLASLLDQLPGMRFAGHLVAFDDADRHQPSRPLQDLDRRLARLRDSHYIGGHLMCDPQVEQRIAASGARLVTILRDPRAVVVSGAHYVQTATQLKGRKDALKLFPDHDSVLRALIFGHGQPGDEMYFPEIGARYALYAGWAASSTGITVRFEDLIGGRGGGADDVQHAEVARILHHLGYDSSTGSAAELADRLFSEKAITFRAGTIDSWRADLPDDLAKEITTRCAVSMSQLGYEA